MGGGQDVDLHDEPLPPWALRRATGDYLELGAVLPTRDGRQHGNATVLRVDARDGAPGVVAIVVTDAGNEMRMTVPEVEEAFWPPTLVRRPRPEEPHPLEPLTYATVFADDQTRPSAMLLAETSSAISLKRIADALQGTPSQLGLAALLSEMLGNSVYNAITSACSGVNK